MRRGEDKEVLNEFFYPHLDYKGQEEQVFRQEFALNEKSSTYFRAFKLCIVTHYSQHYTIGHVQFKKEPSERMYVATTLFSVLTNKLCVYLECVVQRARLASQVLCF